MQIPKLEQLYRFITMSIRKREAALKIGDSIQLSSIQLFGEGMKLQALTVY